MNTNLITIGGRQYRLSRNVEDMNAHRVTVTDDLYGYALYRWQRWDGEQWVTEKETVAPW